MKMKGKLLKFNRDVLLLALSTLISNIIPNLRVAHEIFLLKVH